MTQEEAIQKVNSMTIFEKLSIYMDMFIRINTYQIILNDPINSGTLEDPSSSIVTFDQFINEKNIQIKGPNCDDWKERGYASKTWINLNPCSIYHCVYHSLDMYTSKERKIIKGLTYGSEQTYDEYRKFFNKHK